MDFIGNHVSKDQIRFALGVSTIELSDVEIDSSGLEQELQLEVDTWIPDDIDVDAIYTNGSAPAASSADKLLFFAFSKYLKYYAAYLTMVSGEMKFAKKLSDKSNDFDRNPLKKAALIADLQSIADAAKSRFLVLSGETIPDPTEFAGISSPSFDPVTG